MSDFNAPGSILGAFLWGQKYGNNNSKETQHGRA